MDHPVRLARAVMPGADQAVELLAQRVEVFGCRAVVLLGLLALGPLLALGGELLGLPFFEQVRHLFGLQQARDAKEILFLVGPQRAPHAELAAVEHHPVEVRGRLDRLERQLLTDVGVVALAVGLGDEVVVQAVLAYGAVEDMVAFGLHLRCVAHQGRHRGQEHGRGLAPPPRADETADGLGEEQGCGGRGGVHAHREARGEEQIKIKDFAKVAQEAMELANIPKDFSSRYLNDGFSGGEKKRMELLQLALLRPEIAILDETDSGLDIDALRVVAEGVNKFAGPDMGVLIITHYQRILHMVKPDFVHVMFEGRIVKEGGPELVGVLEEKGYGWIREEVAAGAGA